MNPFKDNSSWSLRALACFWILCALCLRLLKLCLLLFDLCTVLFVGSGFWLLAFVITKSICSLATRWVGSLSKNSFTFLYWTSFRTRCSSFSRSFWPIMACDIATNAALAYWRTSWLASCRYFANCTSSLSFSLKNRILLSSYFTIAHRHWQNLSLWLLERLFRFCIWRICRTFDSWQFCTIMVRHLSASSAIKWFVSEPRFIKIFTIETRQGSITRFRV